MIAYDGLSPQAFLTALDAVVANPAGRLSACAQSLLSEMTPDQIAAGLDRRLGEAPSLVKHAATLMTLPAGGAVVGLRILPSAWTAGLAAATLTHAHARTKHARRQRDVFGLLSGLRLERAGLGLTEKEKGLIRAWGALFAAGTIVAREWDRFTARMVWADGKCTIAGDEDQSGHKALSEARLAPLMLSQ